ncbi:MAG: ral secretion pathway protein GspM [Polaromonas sp.]|nr:ral secretion pathway protein GspM [Polaromonas sp.]
MKHVAWRDGGGTFAGGVRRTRELWQSRDARERHALGWAAAAAAALLLWWLALAPALEVLRGAPARHLALDAQLRAMHSLQAEAAALRAMPGMSTEESLRLLTVSVRQQFGGAAQLEAQGGRATVTLKGVPPGALAAWLAQARVDAHAVPLESQLRLNAARTGWDGSMVLGLPHE